MPPGRPARQRIMANENDENSDSTRITRAKAASLSNNADAAGAASKPLVSKKSAANASQPARKRAALGDVSNVTKVEAAEGKKAATKTALATKAAQPAAAHKKTASTATRAALAPKEQNKKVESKRSAPDATGAVKKRRASVSAKEEQRPEEGEPVRKKAHTSEVEKAKPEEKPEEVEPKEPKAPKQKEPAPAPKSVQSAPAEFQYPEGVKNLDSEDLEDPLMVAEYATEIFEYLRDLECHTLPNPQYMSLQDDLEWKTRGILIDWLIEVHTRFHLLPETLFLAINIIDRFLSEKVVQLERLQLVGITAMFIAAKYEEIVTPHVGNFKFVADDGFSESEILSAERFILSTLKYDLSYPNPINFLRRISKADNYDIQCRTIAKYLLEISLLDHRFLSYRPSHIAAGAMFLARLMLDRGDWDETIAWYAGYSEEEVEPVSFLMVDYLARPLIHEAFFKKYASKKFMKASLITRNWARRNATLYGITDLELSLDEISP